MDLTEKTEKENYVYKGRILNLKNDDVILPNNDRAQREYVEHNGGSAVLCVKDGKVLMVKQFRYPYRKEIWEIPAGKVNKGETPEETAKRELEEEGGIVAEKLVKLFEVYPSPAYTNEIIYVYQAENVKEGKIHLDKDEFLSSKWFTKKELKDMIDKGEINDSKTLIALLKIL